MFSGIQSYVIMALVIMLVIMSGVSYWYFSYSQQQIGTLRENAAKLEQAVQTQQQTIQAQQEAQERSNREVLLLQNRLSGAERTRRDLEVRLRQQNLEAQARTRRQDTERDINQQMQSQWTAFEQLSGFTPTPAASPPAAPTHVRSNRMSSDPQPPPRPPVRGTPP